MMISTSSIITSSSAKIVIIIFLLTIYVSSTTTTVLVQGGASVQGQPKRNNRNNEEKTRARGLKKSNEKSKKKLKKSKKEKAAVRGSKMTKGKTYYGNKPSYGLYLAGPEVFLSDPISAGEKSKSECEKVNNDDPSMPFKIEAFYPLDAQIEGDDFAFDQATGYKIFYANIDLIDSSTGTVANMIRFRGPSMDVGTALEMGYTMGTGKPVFGYYDAIPFYGGDEEEEEEEGPGHYGNKVVAYGFSNEPTGYDHNNHFIEPYGFSDNLMLLGTLEKFGYDQRMTVYESCLDAVDWISKNCPESEACIPL